MKKVCSTCGDSLKFVKQGMFQRWWCNTCDKFVVPENKETNDENY